MKLWVMRHGPAGEKLADPKAERERPLTTVGRHIVTEIAQNIPEAPNVIFASQYTRAVETADIIGNLLGVRVDTIDALSPNSPLEVWLEDLFNSEAKRVMIVGHNDNLDPLFNWDTLAKGEVRQLKIDRDSWEYKIKWSLRPSDLGYTDEYE